MLRLDRRQIEEKKLKIRLEVFSTKSKQRVVKDKQRKRARFNRGIYSRGENQREKGDAYVSPLKRIYPFPLP